MATVGLSGEAQEQFLLFPGLLFEQGLSGYQEEKILIRLDAEAQDFTYRPDRFILNRFDVFTSIMVMPPSILLSQKLWAILNRKRKKGRDFYDVVILFGMGIQPDFRYLEVKANIRVKDDLKERIMDVCYAENMDQLAQDVRPFLFKEKDVDRVRFFPEYFLQIMG